MASDSAADALAVALGDLADRAGMVPRQGNRRPVCSQRRPGVPEPSLAIRIKRQNLTMMVKRHPWQGALFLSPAREEGPLLAATKWGSKGDAHDLLLAGDTALQLFL